MRNEHKISEDFSPLFSSYCVVVFYCFDFFGASFSWRSRFTVFAFSYWSAICTFVACCRDCMSASDLASSLARISVIATLCVSDTFATSPSSPVSRTTWQGVWGAEEDGLFRIGIVRLDAVWFSAVGGVWHCYQVIQSFEIRTFS